MRPDTPPASTSTDGHQQDRVRLYPCVNFATLYFRFLTLLVQASDLFRQVLLLSHLLYIYRVFSGDGSKISKLYSEGAVVFHIAQRVLPSCAATMAGIEQRYFRQPPHVSSFHHVSYRSRSKTIQSRNTSYMYTQWCLRIRLTLWSIRLFLTTDSMHIT